MADLRTNANGIRLITEFEGSPRLAAQLCPAGWYELSYGCRFWPNGRPVAQGDSVTPEQATDLFKARLAEFEEGVAALLTVAPTPNQFSAMVSLAYNVGVENFKQSTVLTRHNENRFEDAAAAFGEWNKATLAKPGKGDDPVLWVSPTGEPCAYKKAFRGLLRRHHAEGCLYLGFDWREATADDAIFLRVAPPENRIWSAGRWVDRIVAMTAFPDVHVVAQKYPLDGGVLTEIPEPKPGVTVTIIEDVPKQSPPKGPPVSAEIPAPATQEGENQTVTAQLGAEPEPEASPLSPFAQTDAPVKASVEVAVVAAAPVKPLSPNTAPIEALPHGLDPTAGAKPIEESDRVKALHLERVGEVIIRMSGLGFLGTTAKGLGGTLMRDPVLMAVAEGAVASGLALGIGFIVTRYAKFQRAKANEKALQVLY